jgi:AAA family ATP:ADP antiporter
LASKVPRHILITWTTLFFVSNIVVFYFLSLGGMPVKTMGIIFFIWVGIFNYFVVAQFWGFANDLYSDEVGKRTFPLIAFGATLGGVVGTLPLVRKLRDLLGGRWEYKLMLIAGTILLLCIVLATSIAGTSRRPGMSGKRAWPGPRKRPGFRSNHSRPAADSASFLRAATSF